MPQEVKVYGKQKKTVGCGYAGVYFVEVPRAAGYGTEKSITSATVDRESSLRKKSADSTATT